MSGHYEPIYRSDNSNWKNLSSRPDGFYIFDGKRIPIYRLILRKKEIEKDLIIIATKESIILEQTIDRTSMSTQFLQGSGFTFKVEDPLTDSDFRKQLVAEERDWLKDIPPSEKETYAAMYVGIAFLQRVDVNISNPDKIIVRKLAQEDQELE
jgi:hypothetical protein